MKIDVLGAEGKWVSAQFWFILHAQLSGGDRREEVIGGGNRRKDTKRGRWKGMRTG